MPRPKSLTLEDVAAVALAVVDREGIAGLTMRAVAKELGLATMGLYRYVASRDELEAVVVNLVVRDIDPDVSRRLSWSNRIVAIARRMREAMAAHPEAVPLVLARRQSTVASLALGENLLAALADGGIHGRARTIAFRAILAYVVGAVLNEHRGSLSGEGTATIAALDPASFPNLVDAASHAATIDADAEFVGGLDLILRGLGARPRRR